MHRDSAPRFLPLLRVRARPLSLALAGALLATAPLRADELQGRVIEVSGGEVRVSLDSDVLPEGGDRAVVYYQREGSGKRAVVGEGLVAGVEGRVVVVTMDDPASAVQVGHQVQISASPPRPGGEAPLGFDAAVRRLIESSYRDFEDVRGEFDQVAAHGDRIYECTVRFEEAVEASVWVHANGDPAEFRSTLLRDARKREAEARFDELEKALRSLSSRDWTIEESDEESESMGFRSLFCDLGEGGGWILLESWPAGDGREGFDVALKFKASPRGDPDRQKCRTNLNQIGKGSIIYADEHNDRFPPLGPGFFEALRDGILEEPSLYVCPLSGDEIGETSYATWSGGGPLTWAQILELGSRVPLAWDKDLANHGDVRNVLYHDGVVEEMSEDDFQSVLKNCEEEFGLKR